MGKHTFVICAYKESQYLEECIRSLRRQTVKSNIIMVTSTPNSYISDLAKSIISLSLSMKGREGLPRIGILAIGVRKRNT